MKNAKASLKMEARRETSAMMARGMMVIGASIWLACLGANLIFTPSLNLFYVGLVGAGLCAGALAMRGMQLVLPRRFPYWFKLSALVFLVIFGYGLFFGLTMLGGLPLGDRSPLKDSPKE